MVGRPAIILLILSFFTGYASAKKRHKRSYRLTWSYFTQGYSNAIKKAIEKEQEGKMIQAMEAVRRAAYHDPHARLMYGRLALKAGRYKEAKWALCPRLSAMKAVMAWKSFWCGQAELALGRPGAALRRFERAKQAPGGPGKRLVLYRALAMWRIKRQKQACKLVRKRYGALPPDDIFRPLMACYKSKISKEQALHPEQKTPKQSQNQRELFLSAKAAFKMAKYQQAMDALKALNPDCRVRNLIARTTQRLRDYSTAMAMFLKLADDKACKGKLRGDWLLYRAAVCAIRSNDTKTALMLAKRMIREFPKTTLTDDLLVTLARVALFRGQYEKAMKLARQSQTMFPNGDFRWYGLWVEFLANYMQKRYKQALKTLDQARQCTDGYLLPRFAYWRARTMEKTDKRASIKALWQVVEAWPMDYYGVLAANRLAFRLKTTPYHVYKRIKNTKPPLKRFIEVPDKATLKYGRPAMIKFLMASGMEGLARAELSAMWRGKTWEKWVAVLGFYRLKDLKRATGMAWRLLQKQPFFPKTRPGQQFYKLAYPRPFAWHVKHYARLLGLNLWLVYGVIRRESVFDPSVVSWAGAIGLMQLMPATARRVARRLGYSVRTARRWSRRDHLTQVRINLKLGTWYLNYLMHLFHNPLFAAAGYNAGEASVYRLRRKYPHRAADELVELIEARETRRYVRAVVEGYARYRFLYGRRRYLKLDFKVKF